ncbi:MFS transporter [Burkholderia sp. FERM BP-3421]|jgi:MFS family permease|uniref:MFS transporter n=1 Tax=Burkholderia sp. FERM BP-3421 TaxID=1494466 RepID=UPI00235F92EF|nr:MFS transporter [Burkholderia sp. FERM BP-3421]WDD94495.1 MFS transporter [Burkholderia sp. FERM BP-3421]
MIHQQRYALFALLLAGFVTIFDLFVVNIAIVNIEHSLQASYIQLTMIIVAYELSFGLLLITGGRLGDLWGRRRTYRIGMVCFTVSSIFCGLSPNAECLIAARFLQGLSAALLFPQIYASIRSDFDAAGAGRAFAYLGMTLGLAAVAGQVLGGLLISLNLLDLQWRSIFFINLPIGIVALYFSRALRGTSPARGQSIDWGGVILSSVGISAALLPLLMISAWGWDFRSYALLLAGLGTLYGFTLHESRYARLGRTPLIDMALLQDASFVKGSLLVMCIYATAGSFTLAFSILLQSGLKLSPFQAGMVYVATSVGFSVSSLLMPKLIHRHGPRCVFVGAAAYAASFAALILAVRYLPIQQSPWRLLPVLFMLGLTQGMVMTPMLNIVLANVRDSFAGMAAGVLSTLQQVGAAFGVTAVSTIMQLTLEKLADLPMFAQLQSAFVYSMLFNVGAAAVASRLLLRMAAPAQQA